MIQESQLSIKMMGNFDKYFFFAFLHQISFLFRLPGWFQITNEIEGDLFFPKISFENLKSLEKQLQYGVRSQEYYWMNSLDLNRHFEYYEIFKVNSYCNFDFSEFPFDDHICNLIFGSSAVSELFIKFVKPTLISKDIQSRHSALTAYFRQKIVAISVHTSDK